MKLLDTIKEYAEKNKEKRIAMFLDMDGVIASLDVDVNHEIASNKPHLFLNKRPLVSVISLLEEVSHIPNIDLYVLSACVYSNQAEDKRNWLEKYAPFIKKENQIFVIKEVVKYTPETKAEIKTSNILKMMRSRGYDLAIYFEDEFLMLRAAYKLLKEKVLLIHISNFID